MGFFEYFQYWNSKIIFDIMQNMKLTNNNYIITICTKNFTEKYFRDEDGWVKISAKGNKFE